MLRQVAAAGCLLAFSATGALAGEFFSGTKSDSTRFDRTRTSVGSEQLRSTREYENSLEGQSHKHFGSISVSAENLRVGERNYKFIEGDAEINAAAAGVFASEGDDGEFEVSAWPFSVETDGEQVAAVAGAGEVGVEIDGMKGWGSEYYLDGSGSLSYEFGRAGVEFEQEESGELTYSMKADFTEVETVDGTRTSAGSVFSFN